MLTASCDDIRVAPDRRCSKLPTGPKRLRAAHTALGEPAGAARNDGEAQTSRFSFLPFSFRSSFFVFFGTENRLLSV